MTIAVATPTGHIGAGAVEKLPTARADVRAT